MTVVSPCVKELFLDFKRNFDLYFPPLKEDYLDFEECDIPSFPHIQKLWNECTPIEKQLVLKWLNNQYQ